MSTLRKTSVLKQNTTAPSPGEVVLLAQAVFTVMQTHGVIPHPRNYALWYAYLLGDRPELNHEIDRCIAQDVPFTDAHCEQLYADFLAATDLSVAFPAFQGASPPVRPERAPVTSVSSDGLLGAVAAISGYQAPVAHGHEEVEVDDGDELTFVTNRNVISDVPPSLGVDVLPSQDMQHIQQHLDALRRDGRTCPATGLMTQRVFKILLKENLVLAEYNKQKVSVILMAVDNLQHLSGGFGERAGDQILRLIGRVISENVKSRDTVAHYGKNTFAVLLMDADEAEAIQTANAICNILSGRNIINRRTLADLGQASLSLGVTQWQSGQAAQDVLRRATEALFNAKVSLQHSIVSES